MPWSLIHLERTLFAFQQIPEVFDVLIPHCAHLVAWFAHYAFDCSTVEKKNTPTPTIDSARNSKEGGAGSKPSTAEMFAAGVVKKLFESQPKKIDDATSVGITYKSLSKFCHDFGLIPYVLKETQLFGYGSHFSFTLIYQQKQG
jgi:hypothetical protein